MKASLLVLCCALAIAPTAHGQAFGESVQLSQPALHSTGAATAVPTSPLSRSGMPQQNGVQVVNDSYRGQADCHCAKPPVFLPSPKDVLPGTVVILTSPNPNAVIYYTADGWTPTEMSAKYETPIPILGNTRIQAFAVEPGKAPSPIVAGNYTLSGAPTPLPPDEAVSGSTLPKGTPIRLQTGNRLTS